MKLLKRFRFNKDILPLAILVVGTATVWGIGSIFHASPRTLILAFLGLAMIGIFLTIISWLLERR